MGNILNVKFVYQNWHDGYPITNGLNAAALKEVIRRWEEPSCNAQSPNDLAHEACHAVGLNFPYHLKSQWWKQAGIEEVRVQDIDPQSDTIWIYPNNIMRDFGGVVSDSYDFFSVLSPELLAFMRSGTVKILFDNSHDPTVNQAHCGQKSISYKFELNGINPNNVLFIAGDTDSAVETTKHLKMKIIPLGKFYPWCAANTFVEASKDSIIDPIGLKSEYVTAADLDSSKIRKHKFLSFNRSLRPHRLWLLCKSIEQNWLKDNLFSFLSMAGGREVAQDILLNINSDYDIASKIPNSGLKNIIDRDSIPWLPPIAEFSQKVVDEAKKIIPLELDTQSVPRDNLGGFSTSSCNNKQFYSESYFNITTETGLDYMFLSEKTFRPIQNLQPFIFIGPAGALKYLKTQGFKTFDSVIDESYDLEADPSIRLTMIAEQINKINNMDMQTVHDMYYSLTDILIHNQQHLLTFCGDSPYIESMEYIKGIYSGN